MPNIYARNRFAAMENIIIPIVALLGSLLTFFSGFGLGTLLLPVFAIFYPIELAVALTGVVHLLNNLFKMGLIHRSINWKVGLKFGVPAFVAAIVGAWVLTMISGDAPLYTYTIFGLDAEVTAIGLVIGLLMIFFAIQEVTPVLGEWHVKGAGLTVGGSISGFFGGLSGHQGALRSMFLLKAGLSKEAFIATGVLIACAVDIGRLGVYYDHLRGTEWAPQWKMLTITILAAFVGAYFGKKLLKKITISTIQWTVSILISLMGALMVLGII